MMGSVAEAEDIANGFRENKSGVILLPAERVERFWGGLLGSVADVGVDVVLPAARGTSAAVVVRTST